MVEELDDLGVPIRNKKPISEVDDLGVPLKKKESTNGNGVTSSPASSQVVERSQENGVKDSFDSEGIGYDYKTADAYGIKPDASGHWQSRQELPELEAKRLGLPVGSGVILKGKSHPTFSKTVAGEEKAGYKIIKLNNRYYSVPKDFQQSYLQEANQTFQQQQDDGLTEGVPVGRKTDKRAREVVLHDKQKELELAQQTAAISKNAIDENSQYPVMQEIESLYKQANDLQQTGQDASGILSKIEELKALPVDDNWRKPLTIQDEHGGTGAVIPTLKKSAYKTYGDMLAANEKEIAAFNTNLQKAQTIDTELAPAIQDYRNKANYIPDGKDAQGNEYLKLNPMQAFVNGFGGSVDAIALGLKKLNPLYSAEELKNDLKIKYLRENVLFPKQAEGKIATGAEMLGGVAPLIAGGAAATTGLGAMAMNALTFGAMDLGAGTYEGFVEGKAKGMSDEEAMEFANKIGLEKGATGVLLGATLPAQGAAGRKLFLNSTEAGAFKKMLAEQGVMVPTFMSKTAIDNIGARQFGSERSVGEGVAESGISAFVLAGMTHAIGAGLKLPKATKDIYENALAKNYESLAGVFSKGVQEGTIDFATSQRIAEKAKAFETIGKDLSPKEEVAQLPLQMEIDALEKAKEGKTGLVVDEADQQIEVLNDRLKEERGSPLTFKEQKEYEKIIEKRDAPAGEGQKKPELLDSEKSRLKHFEARIKQSGKNEANKTAQELGYDHAKHLLNDLKAKGLGEFESVQEVPKKTFDELQKIKDAEAKKADIERRREEEYRMAFDRNNPPKQKSIIPTSDEELARIDSKYDAELAALEKPTNAKTTEPTPNGENTETGIGKDETTAPIETETATEQPATGEENVVVDSEKPLTTEEAVKFLDDHLVQGKIEKFNVRPDFKLSSEELTRGMKQIREGKTQMVAAKKVLEKISEWKKQGFVDAIQGSGGITDRLQMPFEFTLEQRTEVEAYSEALDTKDADLDAFVAERFTNEDGTLNTEKLRSEIEAAGEDMYFGDLLGLSKEELLILQDKLQGGQDKASNTTAKETSTGNESEISEGEKTGTQTGDYKTITEEVEMPDGEKGVRVTIEKPDGEKVELGNLYPEDVEKEVAKKIRGFELQRSKSEQPETIKTDDVATPKEDVIGKQVTFEQAGSEKTGTVQSIDEKGNYKVKDSRGINYTVKPENTRSAEIVEQAKKSVENNLKKLQDFTKPKKGNQPPDEKIITATLLPTDVIKIPFKALGMGDKLVQAVTAKIEDGVGRAFRSAMGNSNNFLSRSSSEAQGLFKLLALTGEEISKRRMGMGAINSAPLKAVNFYKNAVDIVGKTPESLRNVHMVLDPEVYTKRGETPMDEAGLSPTEKNLFDLLRSMNNMIHDWHYANKRISEETYLQNKDKYAPRFYENIEFEGYPEDLKQAFEDYSKQQNFSYIKERKAFEDVMGENKIFEDPVYGTAMRLAQMMRNQAVMEYAADINSRVKTYEEGDANIPNSYVKLEGGGKFKNINTYGQLTNKYVPRDVAEDFKGYFFINEAANQVYNAAKWYDRLWLRQALKKTKTLYNPITQLGNIGSNYVFAMMNGIDPLSYQRRKFEAAKIVKEQGPLYLQLTEEGLLGTDITTKDLKVEAKGEVPKTGIRGKLSEIDDAISGFYGSRDEIAKIAAYLSHTKDYGRSHKEALERVYSGFQNYNNVGRFYDFAAKTPVVGNPFVKFKGDLLRIMKNNFSQRPLTNIALLAALNGVATALSNISEEDEDVREVRERRPFIPKIPLPDAVGGDIPLVWKTPYGEINAARYFSPLNIYDMGDKSSAMEEASQFLPYQVKPSEESGAPIPNIQDPFIGPFVQLAFNKDFRGQPILDPQSNKFREGNATKEEKMQNAATFIARQQIPFFANADDMIRAYNGEEDYYGRNKDLKQALLSSFIKIQEFEKPEAIETLNKEIDFRLGQLDRLNKAVSASKNLAKKNIEEIKGREVAPEQEQRLIAEQHTKAQNKIAEYMVEQARIKQELIEPELLLKKLGGRIKSSGGNSKFKFKTFSKFGK